jgi:hypothetical protein
MTQTEITHSSFTYDRKPIDVLPNTCALPERGERAMDSLPDGDSDLELWAPGHRKRNAAKSGYFHPRACEAIEYEAVESSLPEQPSSLLFARDSSYLSSPFRKQNDALNDGHARTLSHFRPIPTIGTLDASDAAGDPAIASNFHLNGAMDACQFIQHIPHMDLSLPFIPAKPTSLRNRTQQVNKKECASSSKKRSTTHSRTIGNTSNHFERTRSVVSSAGCGGFDSGFYDSGCLGGF